MGMAERPNGGWQHDAQRRTEAARHLQGVFDAFIFVTDEETQAIARMANREALERDLQLHMPGSKAANRSRQPGDSLQ